METLIFTSTNYCYFSLFWNEILTFLFLRKCLSNIKSDNHSLPVILSFNNVPHQKNVANSAFKSRQSAPQGECCTSVFILSILSQNTKKTHSRMIFNKINNCIASARRFLINKTGVIVFYYKCLSAKKHVTIGTVWRYCLDPCSCSDSFTHYCFCENILISQTWKGLRITGIYRPYENTLLYGRKPIKFL